MSKNTSSSAPVQEEGWAGSQEVEQFSGIPVPEEGSAEFARLNKMAKVSIPLTLIIFTFMVLEQQAFGMIFVNIGQQLGQPGLASLITSIPGIVLGIVCVIYGSLGDFISLKKMMLFGTVVFVLGSALGFLCGGLGVWWVVAARVLQSAGGQVAGSVFLVLVSKYIERKNRVIYYGIFVAIFRFSAALGVMLAGYMTLFDWRWLFAAPMLTVFLLPFLSRNLPDEHAAGAHVDGVGFVLIGLFAGAVTMFFTYTNWAWACASVLTLIAFMVYICRAKNPFITPQFFRNPAFVVTMLVIFIGYFFSYTLNAGVNAIGLNVYGIDSATVSNLLVWSILLAAVLGFASGPIIKKIGRSTAIIVALTCMGFGLIAIAWLIPKGQFWALAVAPCLYYIGTSFFYSPIVDTATLTVSAQESGRVMGFNDLIQAITGSIGVAVFSQMMAAGSLSSGSFFGTQPGDESTYSNVFMIGGCIILVALVLWLVFKGMIFSHSRIESESSDADELSTETERSEQQIND